MIILALESISTLPFQCPRLFMFIILSAIAIFGYLCFNLIATFCTSSTYALINLDCYLSCAHVFFLVFNIFASVWVFSGPATDNPLLGNECDTRVVRGVQYYLVDWWVYLTLFALALCRWRWARRLPLSRATWRASTSKRRRSSPRVVRSETGHVTLTRVYILIISRNCD
jgi:hypothetical protein